MGIAFPAAFYMWELTISLIQIVNLSSTAKIFNYIHQYNFLAPFCRFLRVLFAPFGTYLKKNIYILSNSQEDIEKCKKAFFKWKDITQQWHHLIFSDFWCIMLLCQIKETCFFGGQFNVSRLHLTPKVTPASSCQNSW